MSPSDLSDSDRYRRQAEVVMRLAANSAVPSEKDVYLSIADGWRKLAAQALHNERQDRPPTRIEPRSFRNDDADSARKPD